MRKKILILIGTLILLTTNHVWAEEKKEASAKYNLGEVLVTATKTEEYQAETGSSTTVITADDLKKYAWCKNVHVIDNQIDFKPVSKPSKKEKSFVYCGRLKKSKRVHDCIKALVNVKDAKLYIIGNGDEKYKEYLEKLVKKLNLENRVVFSGYLSIKKRNELMAKSLAILVTSVREGWGLIVTEANANGTLAITYDVPGLRDANKTGFITKKNNPNEIAKYMSKVMMDESSLKIKSKDSIEFANKHSDWDKNVRMFEKVLMNE